MRQTVDARSVLLLRGQQTWSNPGRQAGSAFLVVVALACSSALETTGTQASALIPSAQASLTVNGGSETVVADVTGSSPTGRTFNSVVVAFNNNNLPTPIAGKLAGVIGWSVSSDLSHTTWTTHAENSSLNDVFLTGPAPIMADSAPYAATAGDPALVATGCPGQLALASLGGSATNPAVDIVMAISNDGGNSFKNLKRMSDNTSAGTGVDQPKLVMEEPGTQVGWVVWANFNNPWAAFGRRLHFNCATGDIDPPGPITDLRLDSPMLNFLNVTPVCGKTPILDNCAGAGIEHMFVAYPDLGPGSGYLTQAVPNRPVDCGPGNFNPLTDDIVWTLAFGNPGSWNLVNAARDRFDPLCVVNELIGNAGVTGSLNNGKQPGNQRWEPAMVYEPKLRKVHVFLSLSQYWGKSGVRDDSRGTRIHHITWDGMGWAKPSTLTRNSAKCLPCLTPLEDPVSYLARQNKGTQMTNATLTSSHLRWPRDWPAMYHGLRCLGMILARHLIRRPPEQPAGVEDRVRSNLCRCLMRLSPWHQKAMV